jgi:hypothetical protein
MGMDLRPLSRLKTGEIQSGTAAKFEDARAEFVSAWKIFFANRTDADFQICRYQRDLTALKYATWDAGFNCRPAAPNASAALSLTINGVTDHIQVAHLMEAA